MVSAIEVWLRQRQATGGERAEAPWSGEFESSAVGFAEHLINENRELFEELARR